jgi:hypothetical protein
MKFDMFWLDNIDNYSCLRAHVSIESIQLATTIGNFTIAPLDLDLVACEGEDNGVNSTSCDNDG